MRGAHETDLPSLQCAAFWYNRKKRPSHNYYCRMYTAHKRLRSTRPTMRSTKRFDVTQPIHTLPHSRSSQHSRAVNRSSPPAPVAMSFICPHHRIFLLYLSSCKLSFSSITGAQPLFVGVVFLFSSNDEKQKRRESLTPNVFFPCTASAPPTTVTTNPQQQQDLYRRTVQSKPHIEEQPLSDSVQTAVLIALSAHSSKALAVKLGLRYAHAFMYSRSVLIRQTIFVHHRRKCARNNKLTRLAVFRLLFSLAAYGERKSGAGRRRSATNKQARETRRIEVFWCSCLRSGRDGPGWLVGSLPLADEMNQQRRRGHREQHLLQELKNIVCTGGTGTGKADEIRRVVGSRPGRIDGLVGRSVGRSFCLPPASKARTIDSFVGFGVALNHSGASFRGYFFSVGCLVTRGALSNAFNSTQHGSADKNLVGQPGPQVRAVKKRKTLGYTTTDCPCTHSKQPRLSVLDKQPDTVSLTRYTPSCGENTIFIARIIHAWSTCDLFMCVSFPTPAYVPRLTELPKNDTPSLPLLTTSSRLHLTAR